MSVQWISVDPRAWRPDRKRVPDAAFTGRLLITPDDRIVSVKKGKVEQAARVTLVALDAGDFSNVEEPSEAFAEALRAALQRAGRWLSRQPSAVFKDLRQAGCKVDLFIGAWIDMDQLDLDLPPELLRACGKHRLPVSIITND